MIQESFDIGDSPQINIKLPLMRDIDISQSYFDDSKDSKPKPSDIKSKQEVRRSSMKDRRVKPIVLRNVDGVLPEELFEFSKKKINVEQIERELVELEKIEGLWKEMVRVFKDKNQTFQSVPNFEGYEMGENEPVDFKANNQEIVSASVPSSSEEYQFVKVQHHCVKVQQPSTLSLQAQIKMVKLRKYYAVIKKKINKFLEEKRVEQDADHFHVCRHCGASFRSGRELGGHMSRRHLGQSIVYKNKTQTHRINKEERNRRKRIRKVKPPTKKTKSKKVKEEESLLYFGEFTSIKMQHVSDSENIFLSI